MDAIRTGHIAIAKLLLENHQVRTYLHISLTHVVLLLLDVSLFMFTFIWFRHVPQQ